MDGPLRVGDTLLGKYEIHAEIGRGGHAVVYHAVHVHLGRHVAVKVLHRRGGLTEEMLQRGTQEAFLLAQLTHENIVHVHDADVHAGQLYLVMEFLRGRSLRDALRSFGRLRVLEVLDVIEAVARGLEVAHAADVVHRDLKPENIFITAGNVPKILDFGVAKAVGVSRWQTHHGSIPGTPGYMSPEQFMRHRATPRSDLHALGLVFYEAAAGVHPLLVGLEKRPNKRELAQMVVDKMPPRLDELVPDVPPYLGRLAHTLLAKDPGDRPESARHVIALVRHYRTQYLAEFPDAPTPRDLTAGKDVMRDALDQANRARTNEHPATDPGLQSRPAPETDAGFGSELETRPDDAAALAALADSSPSAPPEHEPPAPAPHAERPAPPRPKKSALDSMRVVSLSAAIGQRKAPPERRIARPSTPATTPTTVKPALASQDAKSRLGSGPRRAAIAIAAGVVTGAILGSLLTGPETEPPSKPTNHPSANGAQPLDAPLATAADEPLGPEREAREAKPAETRAGEKEMELQPASVKAATSAPPEAVPVAPGPSPWLGQGTKPLGKDLEEERRREATGVPNRSQR